MSSPMFSVIVPIYNVSSFLKQCGDSILAQTCTDFELILVDDGSTDASPGICDAYAERDPRVQVIHKENGGLVSARQAGAKSAVGEYVLCVDGDDWVAPDYIASFAKVIRSSSADIAVCGFYFSYPTRDIPSAFSKERFYDRTMLEEKVFPYLIQDERGRSFPPSVWAKAIRRELYTESQQSVDPQIRIGEDVACTVPCIYRARSMAIIPDCLYYYRQNEVSMTKARKAFSWGDPVRIRQHLEREMDLSCFDFKAQLDRKMTHELFNVAASQFYRADPYRTIAADIKQHLQDPVCAEAIRCADFSDEKSRLMTLAMRFRLLRLIQLWAKVKK